MKVGLSFSMSLLSCLLQWGKIKSAVKAWSPFRVQFKKKSYPWVQLAGHEGKCVHCGCVAVKNNDLSGFIPPNSHNFFIKCGIKNQH